MLKFLQAKPKLLSEHLTPLQDAHADLVSSREVKENMSSFPLSCPLSCHFSSICHIQYLQSKLKTNTFSSFALYYKVPKYLFRNQTSIKKQF